MKNLLMGAICLSLFAIALSLVQISCSKTEAQSSTSQITPINKIVYLEEFPGGGGGGGANIVKFSIVNYDGTGVQHLNITFPPGFGVASFHPPVLSPDATKIFFVGRETATGVTQGIYSCDTSGTNLTRILDCNPAAGDVTLGGAY